MDRKTWTELVEYLVAVVLALVVVWILAHHLNAPLWGGLAIIPLH
jgi:hypothetical protein